MLREPGSQLRREFQWRPDSAWVVAAPPKTARPSPVTNGLLHRYDAETVKLLDFQSHYMYGDYASLPEVQFSAGRQISRLRPTHLRWFRGRW